MTGLGVNIDHVATIRQARQTVEPDPVWAAVQAELAGADCITFHLRKDRRHINDRDARLLKQTVRTKLNMEMSLHEEIVKIAEEILPDQVTLVPENRAEVTTEGGLDCLAVKDRLTEVTKRFTDLGIEVSAFVDPVPEHIEIAKLAGCDAIELHTGAYANAFLPADGSLAKPELIEKTLDELVVGLNCGFDHDLIVHGGHGLTYNNIKPVVELGGFTEFNIGHSIISRSVFVGIKEAVQEMKNLIMQACAD